METRPEPRPRTRTTGVMLWPPQVLARGGVIAWPASSPKTTQALFTAAVLLPAARPPASTALSRRRRARSRAERAAARTSRAAAAAATSPPRCTRRGTAGRSSSSPGPASTDRPETRNPASKPATAWSRTRIPPGSLGVGQAAALRISHRSRTTEAARTLSGEQPDITRSSSVARPECPSQASPRAPPQQGRALLGAPATSGGIALGQSRLYCSCHGLRHRRGRAEAVTSRRTKAVVRIPTSSVPVRYGRLTRAGWHRSGRRP